MKKHLPKTAANKEPKDTSTTVSSGNHRERILKAAMILLANGGRDALTTRAVAEAARLQPPVLYRLFHDKAGLLNAVADYGFGLYMAKKQPPASTSDPVQALRTGWSLHVQFGLTHPELYLLMYADPHPATASPAAERSHRMLRDHMRQVAAAGRLRISEERAALLFHAAACGTVMTLLGTAGEQRDMTLPDAACDAALQAIVTDQAIPPAPTVAAAAVTLRALIPGAATHPSGPNILTQGEHALLIEWLDRLSSDRFSRERQVASSSISNPAQVNPVPKSSVGH